MEPPIDPGEHTVAELRDELEGIEDVEALEAILEAEQAADDRTTARDAIQERIEAVDTALVEERAEIETLDTEGEEEVMTLAGPDDGTEMSERLLASLAGIHDTLEDARTSGGRHEARLRQLENEVSDLTAYTEALEEFLDEHGTAQQLLDSIQDDLAALTEDLDDLRPVIRSHARSLRDHQQAISGIESELSEHSAALDDLDGQVDDLDSRFEDFRERASETHESQSQQLEDLEAAVEAESDRVDDLSTEFDGLADRVDEATGEIDDLSDGVDRRLEEATDARAELDDRISANDDALADNAAELQELADELERLNAAVGDTEDVAAQFQQIEDQLDALQEWRDQVSSVMAGAVAPGTGSEGESDT